MDGIDSLKVGMYFDLDGYQHTVRGEDELALTAALESTGMDYDKNAEWIQEAKATIPQIVCFFLC